SPSGRRHSSGGLGSGRLHHVPRRDPGCPAQLGRGGLPRPRLLQRGGQGGPLRGLGRAAALLRGAARRLQAPALVGARLKRGAHLGGEALRLLFGREAVALVDFVELTHTGVRPARSCCVAWSALATTADGHRTSLNAARISVANSSGSSQAAK